MENSWWRPELCNNAEQNIQGGRQRSLLLKGIFGLVVGLLCLSAEQAYALRCANRLVLRGASTMEVLDKCGELLVRNQRVEYRTVPQPFFFAPLRNRVPAHDYRKVGLQF
jgi:hypothetical protein